MLKNMMHIQATRMHTDYVSKAAANNTLTGKKITSCLPTTAKNALLSVMLKRYWSFQFGNLGIKDIPTWND